MDELRSMFAEMQTSKDAFCYALRSDHNADQLKLLASRLGCWDARSNSKPKNAIAIFRTCLAQFVLGKTVSHGMDESFEDAVARIVGGLEDDALDRYYEAQRRKDDAHEKALNEPETLAEFESNIRHFNGISGLTDSQLAAYDRLRAIGTRRLRSEERRPTTVTRVAAIEARDLNPTVSMERHTKRDCNIWIVRIGVRVERATYQELNGKARQLGGGYSRFSKGFLFYEEALAESFVNTLSGDVDRSDVLDGRRTYRMQTAGARLHELAVHLEEQAEQMLESDKDRSQNTVRRAEMAAGIRGRAYAERAQARTMHALAEALDAGHADNLDGVSQKVQVEELLCLLRRCRTHRNQHDQQLAVTQGRSLGYIDRETADQRPVDSTDIRYATYPYPTIYERHLEEAIVAVGNTARAIRAAEKMQRTIR